MARPKIDPLELAQTRLKTTLVRENVCKISSSVAPLVGTHRQAREVDHRATQRKVEYLQARITMLENGGYRALTSSQRAALKDMRPVNKDAQERRAAAKERLAGILARRAAGDKSRQVIILLLAHALAAEADMLDRACLLADWSDDHAPAIAMATVKAYQDARNRTELLSTWEATDWPKLGLLWLGGLQTPAVQHAIIRVLA